MLNEDAEDAAHQYKELFEQILLYDEVQILKSLPKEIIVKKLDEIEKEASKFAFSTSNKQEHLCISVVTIGFHCIWYSHPTMKERFRYDDLIFPEIFTLTASG